MPALENAVLVRIYTDQEALHGDRPLYREIVLRARQARLAGATVLSGRMGFGESAMMHEHHTFDLVDNLPVVVEIIDVEPKLRTFVESLSELVDIGLITFEKVEVIRYGGAHQRV